MSVYSNKDILAAIEDGTIVCTPFNPKNVSEASLDFTLGFNFYKQEYDDISRVYNPFDESDVNRSSSTKRRLIIIASSML